jgi:hypothetical protein
MNITQASFRIVTRPLALTLALGLCVAPAYAAKYTYHGDLMDGDAPAEGAYDLRVRAFAQPGATKALAEPTELPGVKLSAGRFSVELDLPEDADGMTWVEVAVRRAGTTDNFETLGDPQPISKANGACPGAWALDGNTGVPAGSFIGLADAASSTALILRARNTAVATFTPAGGPGFLGDAPGVALGSSANVASSTGATVGGGGSTRNGVGTICPTCRNAATSSFSTVSGGASNTAGGSGSTVSGGSGNSANGVHSTAGGGDANAAAADYSIVGGGLGNAASGLVSTVSGGESNRASGVYSTVAGGVFNCAGGDGSWAGGNSAKVRTREFTPGGSVCGSNTADSDGDEGTFVWADSQAGGFVSSGPNQFAIRASGGLRWGGTGVNSTTSPAFTHQVDTGVSGNTCSGGSGIANSRTAINHPLLNGNPNAVIVMTPNYGPSASGVAPPRNPLAIYYNNSGADGNCAANRWVIYDVTTTPASLNNGAKFNIWFVLP